MNKNRLILLLAVLFTASSYTIMHKFYVSVTQIEFNESQQSLEVISRIFVDDLEDLLKERYDAGIRLNASEENLVVNDYLISYLNQKLIFKVNGEQVHFTFIGKEYEEELIVCYLEIENVKVLESLEITNQLLLDVFDEQQNIIHVKRGDQRKSLILEAERATGLLKFSE